MSTKVQRATRSDNRRQLALVASGKHVFNPHAVVSAHIKAAGNKITSHFSEIDSALDDGSSISAAVNGKKIQATMNQLIASARLAGFQHGAQVTKSRMPATYGKTIYSAAQRRSKKVNEWMNGTTKKTLRHNVDSEYVLSGDRAMAAARYEASIAYNDGLRDALVGSGRKKEWITGAGESCEDCLANEDQGPIDVDEVFDSGDDYPAAHLNCSCFIAVS